MHHVFEVRVVSAAEVLSDVDDMAVAFAGDAVTVDLRRSLTRDLGYALCRFTTSY